MAVVHKSRGKRSNRKKSDKMRVKVLSLYRRRYQGFGPTLATEKLFERDGVKLSDETLRLKSFIQRRIKALSLEMIPS